MADPQLFLHRSHRMEDLAALLAEHLRDGGQSADPMLAQRVVVGSRGMERWLRQQLCQHNGICANIDFSFPQAVLDEIIARIEPSAASSAVDPWNPDALAWRLAALVRDHQARPELAPVRAYLGDKELRGEDVLGIRRWALAREAADLLDAYALQRPHWLEAWDRGESSPLLPTGPDADWQRTLWIEARRGMRPREPFPMRARRVLDALRGGAVGPQQPLHVFGVTSLPPLFLQLFAALSQNVRVSLYLFAPSLEYWADYASRHSRARDAGVALELEQAIDNQNPLLTALGRVSRDMQHVILENAELAHDEPIGSLDATAPSCLLHHMQLDVRQLVSIADMRRLQADRVIAPDDDSVQVHASHGPARQVEVLRDVLLDLFDRRSIDPRQVIVMTPDVEAYAPLIQAVFQQGPSRRLPDGTWGLDGAPPIPVEVADRSLRSTNAVADALLRVLEMAEARSTASELLDLLGLFPVRWRADISEEQMAIVQGWAAEAGVRWGADAQDRVDAGQPDDDQNTWLFGLRRLALGVVMETDDSLMARHDGGDLIAADAGGWGQGFDSEGALLFGRFAAMVRTVLARVRAMREPRTLPEWIDDLLSAVDTITAVTAPTSWLREQVLESLESLREESASYPGRVSLAVMRRVLDGRFDVPRQGDRRVTGAVTVCSLQPMRNVPFEVVCLLGMDDGSFPRPTSDRGIDLMRAKRIQGDRDAREEDRHLVLEALMAARAHFVVVFGARDPHTNSERPPAGPVADILDCIDLGFSLPQTAALRPESDPPAARSHVIVHHGLQPFSPREFARGKRAFDDASFDGRARRLADQLAKPRAGTADPFRDGGTLEPPKETAVSIDSLIDGLRHPAKLILRTLGVWIPEQGDGKPEDREPVALDSLAGWQVGDQMWRAAFEAARRGGDDQTLDGSFVDERRRLSAQGRLPLGTAGRHAVKKYVQLARQLLGTARTLELDLAGAQQLAIDLRVEPTPGTIVSLQGEVGPITASGDLIEVDLANADGARPLLGAWIRLLAACAGHDGVVRRACLLDPKHAGQGWQLAPPQDPAAAIRDLLALRCETRRNRLPLALKTSFAFASKLAEFAGNGSWMEASPDALEAALTSASEAWEGDGAFKRGDLDDRWIAMAWADTVPYLRGDGLDQAFLETAELLWKPILCARTRLTAPEADAAPARRSTGTGTRSRATKKAAPAKKGAC